MIARLVATLALLATLSSSGCYYTFGTKAPSRPGPADCTTSRALPIADTVIAADGAFGLGFGMWALIALRNKEDAGEGQAGAMLFAITGAGMLILNGLSARAGFRDTADCRARNRPLEVVPAGRPPGSV